METKTKIKTQDGTILKIVEDDGEDITSVECRIKPKCCICGDRFCFCYNEENSENPEQDAISGLTRIWLCGKNECSIKYLKQDNPEMYQELQTKWHGDMDAMVESITYNDDGEGDLC